MPSMPSTEQARRWFLPFSSDPAAGPGGTGGQEGPRDRGSGLPWGDGTAMAAREGSSPPWDAGCEARPLVGGHETMTAMVDDLEDAIRQAPDLPEGRRGRVYLAGWRVDPLRDMSSTNAWGTGPWGATNVDASASAADLDQTAAGLVLRLMQAGIQVRIMVWYPVSTTSLAGYRAHIDGHFYLARLVREASVRLGDPRRGLVALDLRVAPVLTATHHQKALVIRAGTLDVAYCGGVDWAFTRRDAAPRGPAGPQPRFNGGDWQSGPGVPAFLDVPADRGHRWPQAVGVDYTPVADVRPFAPGGSDLPAAVYGEDYQIWHDQHLRLRGPIVSTLEQQFRERWTDAGRVRVLRGPLANLRLRADQVIFSGPGAVEDGQVVPPDRDALGDPPPDPVPAVAGGETGEPGESFVQMWRTVPLRNRPAGPFQRGEFTVMAGVSRACRQARELIWLFDQYFFSRPLARLLNAAVRDDPTGRLNVVLVLPPYADGFQLHQHRQRRLALDDLTAGLATATPGVFDRVAVVDLWDHAGNRGVYCHAKSHTYDDELLVCGSANLNRRSFTCDTELDCAVLDPAAVARHHRRLWQLLFPASAWPTHVDAPTAGWGGRFMDAFRAAVTPESFVIPDPWWDRGVRASAASEDWAHIEVAPPRLPNGVAREQEYDVDLLAVAQATLGRPGLGLDRVTVAGQRATSRSGGLTAAHLDPSSLSPDVETAVGDGGPRDPKAPGRLDEIVHLVEEYTDADGHQPWRTR